MQSPEMQEHGNFSAACGFSLWMAAVLVCAALAVPASAQTIVVIHSFLEETNPMSPFVQGLDGKFYGATQNGGVNKTCSYGCGKAFKIGTDGAWVISDNFCGLSGCSDGPNPSSGSL